MRSRALFILTCIGLGVGWPLCSPVAATAEAPAAGAATLPDRARLAQRFGAEPRDERWAVGYERATRAALADAFPQDRVVALSCATSLCRILVDHRSDDDQ